MKKKNYCMYWKKKKRKKEKKRIYIYIYIYMRFFIVRSVLFADVLLRYSSVDDVLLHVLLPRANNITGNFEDVKREITKILELGFKSIKTSA